jgi:hypothetical protein
VLNGSTGAPDDIAAATITIEKPGKHRIWVRHSWSQRWQGPFDVTALAGDRTLGSSTFDTEPKEKRGRDNFKWSSFDADLPAGPITLQVAKHEHKNCSGYARLVDCLLVTDDLKLVPNHLNYGTQTYLRVTFAPGYDRPLYLHVFADHFHAPWYQHLALGRGGTVIGVAPGKNGLLSAGETSPWCNITPTLYQDSGAALYLTARYTYTDLADHLKATLDFATAPDEKAIVRTLEVDGRPNGIVVEVPPNLLTPENLAHFKTDREIADATGKLADGYDWPTFGRKPTQFPYFVSAHLGRGGNPVDAAVAAREMKTLDNFGFSMPEERRIHAGIWLMRDGSFSAPDVEAMKARAAQHAAEFKAGGRSLKDIVYCSLTDEPTGQPLTTIAKDKHALEPFRKWLKQMGLTPAELLVSSWDDVRPVTEDERGKLPALYYFAQRFRTQALGDFMATQRHILEEAYGGTITAVANFSDGAIYDANFYAQGVDYFQLLSSTDQNGVWSEDWANNSSTYQCASFNVDLLRAAARERGQIIGHHLVTYAGRKGWDIQLKAMSELGRGVKLLNNFYYGPSWGSHEGGPHWKSHAWYARPELWRPNAELCRMIGAAEDMLVPAMPLKAKVAILYSSASDAWTIPGNLAPGFDRMHTWLALAHAQIPVDIVSEDQASRGGLEGYQVCYFTGPNLTRAAAAKLRAWVEAGGTLWLTAGSGMRDEYNRPIDTLEPLAPAVRSDAAELQTYRGAGLSLDVLAAKDQVKWDGGSGEVLSVKQPLEPRAGSKVIATFGDGAPAIVQGQAGRGQVYAVGFLPALAYVKPALVA